GGCLVPRDGEAADLGVLFWHKDGYSTACGHGTIALGAWAVESGRVPAKPDGETVVTIDVPSGRVTARVRCAGGVVQGVAFRNVPSYVLARDVPAAGVRVDLAYGGAVYASVPASAFGLAVEPRHYPGLIAAGRAVKAALAGSDLARYPTDERLSGVYGTILYDDLGDRPDGPHQRNVTVFADGEVDRSPCGSGTCARVALLFADGRLMPGRVLRHDSIVGSSFTARVAGQRPEGVICEVPAGQILSMPAAVGRYAGVKVVTVAPDNAGRDLPRVQGVYLLLDGTTLAPLALLDGIALTALRTPAVSAVAVRHLAAPDA